MKYYFYLSILISYSILNASDISLTTNTISENITIPKAIGLCTVSGTTETISFTVSDNTIWEFSTNSLQRKAGHPIDFESLPVGDKTVSVEITATGRDLGTLTQTLKITVIDVNEPATAVALSNLTVNENEPGALIGMLAANDPDANQTLVFTVQNAGGASGPFVVGPLNALRLAASTAFNFEQPPSSLAVTATVTDQGGLGTSTPFTITIVNQNDPTVVATWLPSNALVIGQADAPTAIASRGIEVFTDEDSTPTFRAFNNKHLRVSVNLPDGSLSDQFIVMDGQGLPMAPSTSQLVVNGRTFLLTKNTQSGTRYVEFTTPGVGTTLADLTELLLRVAYLPDPLGLAKRGDLPMVLTLEDNPAQSRTLILNQANLAPHMNSVVSLTVKRFTQVAVEPLALGLRDDHPELGLTLTIDYPPVNGDLLTGSPGRILHANDTIPITMNGKGEFKFDLVYAPHSSSAEESDACFISVRDHGAIPGANHSLYLSSGFTKLALTITQPDVPSISPVTVGGTWTEGQSAAISLIPSAALLRIGALTNTSAVNMGTWDLYVGYADLFPAKQPATTTEQVLLMLAPGGPITQLGGSYFVAGSTAGSQRLIATVDSVLTGQGQALLVHLVEDASGAEALLLAKSLAYRDDSQRIPVTREERSLFIGFVAKGADLGAQDTQPTRLISNTKIVLSRLGVDNAPHFFAGPAITLATTSAAQIHGTSVIIDLDSSSASAVTVTDQNHLVISGQPPATSAAIDSLDGFHQTIAWILPATATPQDPRTFTLTVNVDGRLITQLISITPLATPNSSCAIVSDAPLILFKTPVGSEPLRRRIRLEQNGATITNATFYLIGDIPVGISVDAAGSAMVYDLAILPLATYRFSLLAALGAGDELISVEQPTLVRVLAATTAN